jgi:hypothetical protein
MLLHFFYIQEKPFFRYDELQDQETLVDNWHPVSERCILEIAIPVFSLALIEIRFRSKTSPFSNIKIEKE